MLFLEQFGIGGAALFAEFGFNRGEKLAGLFRHRLRAHIARFPADFFQKLGGSGEESLLLEEEGFAEFGLGEIGFRGNRGIEAFVGLG